MNTTTVPLGGVSKTLPARYALNLDVVPDEPYPVTISFTAVPLYGPEQTLSCRIGEQTMQELILALTEVYQSLEGDP